MRILECFVLCLYFRMSVIKICPPPSELSVIKTNVHCPEEDCRSVFKNTANLDMHLLKHHKKSILKKSDGVNCQYHCPIEECPYNLNSRQFFKRLKYLKQVICFLLLLQYCDHVGCGSCRTFPFPSPSFMWST
jgi:hypothetical protein